MGDPVWAIGLMSGTSLDGIDAALVYSDGETVFERGTWLVREYSPEFRSKLRRLIVGEKEDLLAAEREMTLLHAEVVSGLLKQAGMKAKDVSVIGFHGQTLVHRPDEGITHQIGDGSLLAAKTGIDVITDFRRRDLAEGGQGAPLVPLYHAALARKMTLPVVIINIGGVANVTWVGRDQGDIRMLAFDTGPGNVLLNEWMQEKTSQPFDKNGEYSLVGKADFAIVLEYLTEAYFHAPPPKSLDRSAFGLDKINKLNVYDGAATLVELTAAAIEKAADHFPAPPNQWLVAGGGRLNPAIMRALKQRLGQVNTVEAVGWDGDALEAQAFAYLALRCLQGLPITYPQTTGVSHPVSGGAFYRV